MAGKKRGECFFKETTGDRSIAFRKQQTKGKYLYAAGGKKGLFGRPKGKKERGESQFYFNVKNPTAQRAVSSLRRRI